MKILQHATHRQSTVATSAHTHTVTQSETLSTLGLQMECFCSDANTYESRARGQSCRRGRQVPDKSLIQAVVKDCTVLHRGDALRAKRLHSEARTQNRGRMQVQLHVLSKGRETVVHRGGEGPPRAMASSGDIVRHVASIRAHLHRGHKHIV